MAGETNTDIARGIVFHKENENANATEGVFASENRAVRAFSGTRILFGAIFLIDGLLKWILIQQSLMQGAVQSVNVFGYSFINDNWLAFGLAVAIGETLGGTAIMIGLFQRPAALGSAAIMFALWAFSGYGGAYMAGVWSLQGYTDPGGDLVLALIFVALVFSPYAYGLAWRFKLRDRWPGSSLKDKVLRFLVA